MTTKLEELKARLAGMRDGKQSSSPDSLSTPASTTTQPAQEEPAPDLILNEETSGPELVDPTTSPEGESRLLQMRQKLEQIKAQEKPVLDPSRTRAEETQLNIDRSRVLLDSLLFGLPDQFQAFIDSTTGETSFAEASKELANKVQQSRKRLKKEQVGPVSEETLINVLGFAAGGGAAPEFRAPKALQKLSGQVTKQTLKKLESQFGPEQLGLVLDRAGARFGSGILNKKNLPKTLNFASQAGASGVGFSDPENAEQALTGLASGIALSTFLGAGLMGVKAVGSKISGLSDDAGKLIFQHARKTGFNLADENVEKQIVRNLNQAQQVVTTRLDDYKTRLGNRKQTVLEANAGTTVKAKPLFDKTKTEIAQLKQEAKKADNKDLLSDISKLEALIDSANKNLRLPSPTEVVRDPVPGFPGQSIPTNTPKLSPNVRFADLDGHKVSVQSAIWEDGAFASSPRVEAIAKRHQRRVAERLESTDVTGDLSGINEVLSSVFEAKAALPTSTRFATLGRTTTSPSSIEAVDEFSQKLNKASEKNLNKYAPEMQADIYAELAPAVADFKAQQIYKKNITLPFNAPGFSQKVGARLAGNIRQVPVLGRLSAEGINLTDLITRGGIIRQGASENNTTAQTLGLDDIGR